MYTELRIEIYEERLKVFEKLTSYRVEAISFFLFEKLHHFSRKLHTFFCHFCVLTSSHSQKCTHVCFELFLDQKQTEKNLTKVLFKKRKSRFAERRREKLFFSKSEKKQKLPKISCGRDGKGYPKVGISLSVDIRNSKNRHFWEGHLQNIRVSDSLLGVSDIRFQPYLRQKGFFSGTRADFFLRDNGARKSRNSLKCAHT